VNPSSRRGRLSFDELVAEFGSRGLPMTEEIKADLRQDQQTNAGTLLHEYEL
jgi:hypothetical protein